MSDSNFFCLEDLDRSAKTIINISGHLPKIREQYEKYKGTGQKREYDAIVDLQKAVKRLWEEFPAVIQLLTEYDDITLANTAKKLWNGTKRFDYLGAADYAPLCNAMEAFAASLPAPEKNINTAALGRLMNRVRMGFFPTDIPHVDLIKQAIVFPGTPVNLLDPCCGEGHALSRFAAGENAATYGMELDENRAQSALDRLTRVGFGSFFYSRASQNAFHCLFLNPPYLSAPSENGSRRLEKSFLADSLRHLMIGGLLIYIIPYYRAEPDICRVLCDNFENIIVYKFLNNEFSKFKQIVFLGTRVPRRDGLSQVQEILDKTLAPDIIPSITELPADSYALPSSIKQVELFKGAVFNEAELAEQLKKSTSINKLFENSALDQRERRPLLPLNLSQIGLIGASGMLNGLVECETPHIIKGRIVKHKKTKVNDMSENGIIEVREVISNKMVFNILTPSGYRSLT